MHKHPQLKTAIYFILIIVFIIGLSIISTRIWGGKPEQPKKLNELIIDREMTIKQFGQANELPNTVLKKIFDLKAQTDLGEKLDEYGTSDQITSMVTKKLALASEHAGKNWIKIPIKFGLWFIFLSMVFILFKKRKVTYGLRNWLACGKSKSCQDKCKL
ncbi:MAG: hypothetical protein KJ826_04580 [Proteobacteria bacterium]|nr:hypothetical protein [Pseudomonadota bacterium]MBU4037449.1 hypothetical protein [Pseudomonadota bacterium]